MFLTKLNNIRVSYNKDISIRITKYPICLSQNLKHKKIESKILTSSKFGKVAMPDNPIPHIADIVTTPNFLPNKRI